MIWYVLTGQKRPRTVIVQELIAAAFALLVVAPIVWLLLDRTPPLQRVNGWVSPAEVKAGGYIHVEFRIFKRTREDCPGTVQQEFIDAQNTIFSKLSRAIGPVRIDPDPYEPRKYEIMIGQEISVPVQMSPGVAQFRTVTFRYCNFIQRWLSWPIVQVGPDIWFTVLPP